ncbi:MAG: GNAT family N-acetyltransferase [Gemmatimonadaceae bacterium]
MTSSATVLSPALKRLDVHAAREQDLAAALALLAWEQEKNPWLTRIPELLRAAVDDPTGEYRACVAERDGELVGFGVYGLMSGAIGTAAIYGVLVAARSRRAGIGLRIMLHMMQDLTKTGTRMIFAEVPGDPGVMRYRALLLAYGFVEETRIDDYYRDGVPQIISRFDLQP